MIDFGVIGVGSMGKHHARILSENKHVNAVYIYDKDKKRAIEIAHETGALVSSSIEDMLGCVDAVTIATPTPTHFELAKTAIEREIHTLVEKPVCHTVEECKQLVEIVSLHPETITGVGHVERFNPVISYIKGIVEEPHYVALMRHNPGSGRITDSSVVEDLMIHDVDIVNYLFPLKREQLPIAAAGDKDTFFCMIDAGFPLTMSASRRAQKKTRTIYVEDTNFTLVGDFVEQTLYVYYEPSSYSLFTQSSHVARINLQRIEPLKTELDVFVSCVIEKEPFPVSVSQGYINVVMCNIIQESVSGKQNCGERVVEL